jgi:hypothetical protein
MSMVTVVNQRRGRISPLAPAYYLGRPAQVWFEALRPHRRGTTPPATSLGRTQARVDQNSSSPGSAATCQAEHQTCKDLTRMEPRNEQFDQSQAVDPHVDAALTLDRRHRLVSERLNK